MTLKEKFAESFESNQGFFIYNSEQIADDYAIEFATFIDNKYYQHNYENNKYAESEQDFTYGKTYTIKELLEIFKKEKGL